MSQTSPSGEIYDSGYGHNWIYGLRPDYIPAMPLDPLNIGKNGNHDITVDGNYYYLYNVTSNAMDFKLMAKLETLTQKMRDDGGIYNDPSGTNLYEVFSSGGKNLTFPRS